MTDLLDSARSGLSGSLLLLGEAGVGKSALLDEAARLAAGFQITWLAGVQSEMRLSYSALHLKLRDDLHRLADLPAPQRAAVELAFGLREGPTPDPFLVGLATLGMLSARAGGQPMLCIIDDVQWLDPESLAVLGFVARRLYADSISMLLAARAPSSGWRAPEGVPVLELTGLAEADAVTLFTRSAAGLSVDPAVARVVAQRAHGNPLALIEVARSLKPDELAGRTTLPDPLPIGPDLELRFREEVAGLPAAVGRYLLAAAADPTGSPGLLVRAGGPLGYDEGSAAVAERAGMVSIDEPPDPVRTGAPTGHVRFRHPLIRSAVYYSATAADRRRVHAALAEATDQVTEPGLHAWHRAEGALGPDEDLAAELELVGDRVSRHGARPDAAEYYRMAHAATPDVRDRSRRALKAAEALGDAGALGLASSMAEEAVLEHSDPWHHAQTLRVQGRIAFLGGNPAEGTAALLAAATGIAGTDIRAARDILVEAMMHCWVNGPLAPSGATAADVARGAIELRLPPGSPTTTGDVVLDAQVALVLGDLRTAVPALKEAIAVVLADDSHTVATLQWMDAATHMAMVLVDEVSLHRLSRRFVSEAREQGNVGMLYIALGGLGTADLVSGLIDDAELSYVERVAIDEARGRSLNLGRLLVAAWRGDGPATAALGPVVEAEASKHGQGYQMAFAAYGRCILALAQGRYDDAFDGLRSRMGFAGIIKWALPDAIEAAVRSGNPEVAADLLAALAALADDVPVARTLGFVARSRGLVAGSSPAAEAFYLEAVRLHETARGPAQLARSQLVYGEWLRRRRRIRDSRPVLRAAHEAFSRMGSLAFADRAEQELRAAGESVRPPSSPAGSAGSAGSGLTTQEANVARLAASGATNAQIAAQLFISASTVDYHLRKVFRKLGISSRRELRSHPG